MDKWEQELEEKIRKKLSEGAVDFDESAWKKMEQRLHPGRRKYRLLPVSWLRIAAAVLLAGFAIWAYTGYFRDVPGQRGEQPSAGNRPAADESPMAENEVTVGSRSPGRGVQSTETEAQSATEERSVPEGRSAKEERTAQDGRPARGGSSVPEEQPAPGVQSAAEAPALAGKQSEIAGASRIGMRGLGRKYAAPAAGPTTGAEPKWPSGQELLAAARPVQREAGAAPASGTATPVSGSGEPFPGKKNIRFSMGVLAAPDLNGVGGLNGGKAGLNMGLGIGLHFNDRLSLHSGIIYSRKPYDARPADYHTGYSPQDLVNIAAVCDVIDIPVNLRYTVYRKGLNSISLNAGLSSYLMLREQYEYQYHYDESRMYEYKNENRHFMGIGNAGLSLERQISDKMSLGLEPFIKVPLTGIGHGSVRLLSAGAAVRLNLDLSKKQNTGSK